MFRPLTSSHRRPHRRGTSILLIALIMLTLFSAVGTAYVFFAIRESRQAQARKEEQSMISGVAAPNPTNTVNVFLSGLITDTGDDGTDLLNSLRGQSIGRAMYGRDVFAHTNALGKAYNDPTAAPYNWALTTPWAGVGLFQDTNSGGARAKQVNYTLGMFGPNALLIDPEYMGERTGITATGVPAFDPTTRTYVGKHAPYTYPDLNNFFLAAIDPTTGQVMLPSFHRPTLFGSLDPSNPNWTAANPQGRLMTLRPRPAEHPLFPHVPPNADNTYTGDVQNWPGGYIYKGGQFYAMNDSLWMNLGLPPVQFGNKKVIPLVAPLIIPVDGQFNASAHGNTFGGAHVSYAGYGPWEVNLSPLLGTTDAASVVNGRGALQQRNLTNTRAFAPYSAGPLPDSAPVAWAGNPVTFSYVSAANSITGLPVFNSFQANNQPIAHPSLFNPTEWPGLPGNPRTYPTSDLKRLQRFGFTPSWYTQADLMSPTYNYTPNSLMPSFAFNVAPGQTSSPAYNYRLDPAHLNRGLLTPRAYSLDRPKVVPNFPNRDGANALSYNTNPSAPNKPGVVSAAAYPSPLTTPLGTVTDFAGQTRWVNVQAALGSVNINRPLADYRANTALPLSAGNMAAPTASGQLQADLDRQQLAYDIFARLIVATGAGATVNPTTGQYTIQAASGTPQYDALRYLAQLAVNVVDYIDNDDISTVFLWNPAAPTEIVYGVEKSRLYINEAYGEIVNDPADPVSDMVNPPMKPAQVRFWLELLNPTQTLTTAPTPGPLGDGSVALSAYQIKIRRETRTIGTPAGTADTNPFGSNQATALFTYPTNAGNTTGNFSTTADATFTMNAVGTVVSPNLPLPPALPTNAYNPPPANLTTNGFVLIGPPAAPKAGGGEEFAPAGGVWANMVTSPALQPAASAAGGMGYTFDIPAGKTSFADQEFKRHIVLLQRLANPYLPFNAATNPYITVDQMDYVPAFDAVHRGAGQLMDRKARSATNATGYDPINDPALDFNRFSIGKVQPYAGHSFAVVTNGASATTPYGYNQYTFGNANPLLSSMVLPQNPTAGVGATTPKNTFGRHNGINAAQPGASTFTAGAVPTLSDTIMLPYDWLVHMDRPLVNQIELFQTRDTAPYLVTDQFVLASVAPAPSGSIPGVVYNAGTARWRFVDDGLARALEFLAIKPYTAGVPHGGRMPAQINLNVVQDSRVITGLFDAPPVGSTTGNAFDQNYVTNTVWSQWMASRSPMQPFTLPNGTSTFQAPVPSQSKFDDFTTGVDIPFLPFGAPAVAPGGTFAYGAGQTGTDLTILRRQTNGFPYLYANSSSKPAPAASYTNSLPDGPSYTQVDPVRKIMNNSTTVSHTYLVFLTIGYFDVDMVNGPLNVGGGMTMQRVAAEAFIAVPGDLRQKFVAVIDMSNMALDPVNNVQASGQPFFTSLETTARANGTAGPVTLNIVDTGGTGGAVAADGLNISVGQQLVLGYGTEQQVVTVQSIPAAGQVSVSTTNGQPFRNTWAGTCVSNVRPGYPGPQGNAFDYNAPQYMPVVPYVERLR